MSSKCDHKWMPVSKGKGLWQDVCENCGALGYIDDDGNICAKPTASVISFEDYKLFNEIRYCNKGDSNAMA